jgi:hypothetical protein
MAIFRGAGGSGDATTDATNEATVASNAATAASTSATAAANSATSAATSATNAANSATSATNSASSATASQTAAATSESNAATSESNAATSATSAANSLDSFDDRYLGSKSSVPTLDNDGNALITGALYWNSTLNIMYVWNGSTWTALNFINNIITVTSNAGTIPVTSKLNTFTNSSAATMTITVATSGAVDGQMTIVRIYDSSIATQTITWVNTENSTIITPTTSNGSTSLPLTVGFMYNSQTSKWRCIASA